MIDLRLGDALTILATLPDSSVDAVITDPPYGTGNWHRPVSGAGSNPIAIHSVESWDRWSLDWLDEALRVSRGPVALFAPMVRMDEVIAKAKASDLTWRMLVWCKSDPKPRFQGQTAWAIEPIFVLRGMADTGGKDWCEASAPRLNRDHEATGHPHQKPLKVMSWILRLVVPPGGLVLDPFAGSGTTGEACIQEGYGFMGVEQDPKYHAMGLRRLAAAQPRYPLFAEAAS